MRWGWRWGRVSASLRRQGLRLNLLALAIVLLGVALTLVSHWAGHVPLAAAVGLFSGATTNTPSLAASQQALKELGAGAEVAALPGLGYAVAYPFGVIGIILSMLLVRFMFGIKVPQEVAQLAAENRAQEPFTTLNVQVSNPRVCGSRLSELMEARDMCVVVSRVKHGEAVGVADRDSALAMGDILLAVGDSHSLEQFLVLVGESTPNEDLRRAPGDVATRRLLVTDAHLLGKTVQNLNWAGRHGVVVTRVHRAGVDISPKTRLRLQFGDSLLAVGSEAGLAAAAGEAGDSPRDLERPSLMGVFVGVALGVFLGSLPVPVPGVPVAVKLGLAGGPLLAAIVLSRIGHLGPLVWYLPPAANAALRELGIILFLACVGLKSGAHFAATLTQGNGWSWMAWGALITFVPLLAAGAFARLVLRFNYATLCGLLAGSMTDPPALAFATTVTASEAPSLSYATVYPLVMLLRVVAAQLLVLLVKQ